MNNMNSISTEKALGIALAYAGIRNGEYRCLSAGCDGGFFRIVVRTPELKYEFYVDAADGEVAGIDMIPLPFESELCALFYPDEDAPAAA